MHWIDNQFFPSVSQSVSRRPQLCPQFFTDFHQILHAAHKCGRFDAYCQRQIPCTDKIRQCRLCIRW